MEMPECPVCLQSYDGDATVPRVLPCGHSVCESCLPQLPSHPSSPDTIRCPACNQIVRFLRSLGPTSLPKNIDLLRLCSSSSSQSPPPKPKSNPSPPPQQFFPLPWTEQIISTWKDWILPPDSLSVSIGAEAVTRTTSCSSPLSRRPSCFRENQLVSLLPIVASSAESGWLRMSYEARVMEALNRLGGVGGQLGFLVEALCRHRRGLCKAYGLWMNPVEEGSSVFLVCERFDRDLSDVLSQGENLSSVLDTAGMFSFGTVGMEMCEAVMGLHSQGIVCGCFGLSCFCFDEFGHCFLDLNDVLLIGRRVREVVRDAASSRGGGDSNPVKTHVFVSPEVLVSLHKKGSVSDCGFEGSVGYGSDVWSLACILIMLLLRDALLVSELFESVCCLLSKGNDGNFAESFLGRYEVWREKVVSALEKLLLGTQFESLLRFLLLCLDYHTKGRPHVSDLWNCIRDLFITTGSYTQAALDTLVVKNSTCCLVLGDLCSRLKEDENVSTRNEGNSNSDNITGVGLEGSSGSNVDHLQQDNVDRDLVKGLHEGGFKSVTLQGHRDCVTGLAVGGGFLFSSSFDKTVHVWSLQDFSHVESLRGHEHKIMAIVVMDASHPLCVSGDSGSGIFVWSIGTSLGQEPLKKWYEHNDWRYSGIHALAVSGTQYLYSGSGDKSIKAWSLQDYSLSCTMNGHKSTVSSLAVADGILYSGSWDGTIRLWLLTDHSPLAVLGDETPGSSTSVLSLSVDCHLLVASYENGYLKMWRNEVLMASTQIQNGAIFALHMDAKWLFTGGWDGIVNIQELSENEFQVDIRSVGSFACDSAITSLLYWHGKLFVGFSNKDIKVYYYGS